MTPVFAISSLAGRNVIPPGVHGNATWSPRMTARGGEHLGCSSFKTFKGGHGASVHKSPPRRAHRPVIPCAILTVQEPSTGVEFPLVQKFWLGEEMRCIGAGVRTKKVAFLGIKVYAVAVYAEAEKAARELGIRARGGFFESDDDYCSALLDGGFHKALQIHLVRNVEGTQFVEALAEALTPRMRLSGEMEKLETFSSFFQGQQLSKGSVITLLYRTDATLDVALSSPERPADLAAARASLCIKSASLCRALFETFLGESSVVPEARAVWAAGARQLLASDEVRRDTRRGGSG
ncbi:hypothetical protein ACKKBG_A06070 [Auxenochlorella protothecoides x Auxenochlorella symbiontica]